MSRDELRALAEIYMSTKKAYHDHHAPQEATPDQLIEFDMLETNLYRVYRAAEDEYKNALSAYMAENKS